MWRQFVKSQYTTGVTYFLFPFTRTKMTTPQSKPAQTLDVDDSRNKQRLSQNAKRKQKELTRANRKPEINGSKDLKSPTQNEKRKHREIERANRHEMFI